MQEVLCKWLILDAVYRGFSWEVIETLPTILLPRFVGVETEGYICIVRHTLNPPKEHHFPTDCVILIIEIMSPFLLKLQPFDIDLFKCSALELLPISVQTTLG